MMTPEYEWRGEYVAEMMRDGTAHPFALYSQAVRVASLALDVLGRDKVQSCWRNPSDDGRATRE